jgi:hypothetical protein
MTAGRQPGAQRVDVMPTAGRAPGGRRSAAQEFRHATLIGNHVCRLRHLREGSVSGHERAHARASRAGREHRIERPQALVALEQRQPGV